MKKFVAVTTLLFVLGCSAAKKEEPVPPPLPPPPLLHDVQWKGQTLEQIAGWYTGKKTNWQQLVQPVNPGLERCCVPLRVGRQVTIPSELLITTEPMPRPKGKTPKTTAAKPKEAAKPVARTDDATTDPDAGGLAVAEPEPEPEPDLAGNVGTLWP